MKKLEKKHLKGSYSFGVMVVETSVYSGSKDVEEQSISHHGSRTEE